MSNRNKKEHSMTRKTAATYCGITLLFFGFGEAALAAESPGRVSDALGLENGFSLNGSHRTRFENLTENLRVGKSENDQVLVMRTILNGQFQSDGFNAQLELMDSRQELADRDSIIGTGTVNSLDILQANIGYSFGEDRHTSLKVGRFTVDGGSRRLLARNRYRNTINSFEGVELRHGLENGNSLRVLATQVVKRLPSDISSLLDNERESDESSGAEKFYALETSFPNLFEGISSEFYFYSIREKDTSKIATATREIDSLGMRFRKAPSPGQRDFEIESVYQFGERRSSKATTNVTNLDHQAFFQFFAVGYSFDVPSRLRVLFEFEYAGGDSDPLDQDSGRFDSVHGVTTFAFGPVGLYGVFSRSNIITPGLRATFNPRPNLNLMASYRHFWLAEEKDSLGRTGLRDATGNTDSYLVQHLELRARWDVIPGNLRIETGVVFLQNENLSDNNTNYLYGGINLTF